MPVLSNDDQARRLRYIWLGPRGFRLPEARFPAWGLFLLLAVMFSALSFALAPAGTRLGLLGCLLALPASLLTTRAVMRHVEHDRSLRYWTNTVSTELSTPRPLTHRAEVAVAPRPDLFTTRSHKR